MLTMLTLLTKIRKKIVKKRLGKLARGMPFLQDNAPVHKSLIVLQKINEIGYELVAHLSYSPDLVPSDYYLSSKLKKIEGIFFSTNDEAICVVEDWFADQDIFLNGLELLYESYKCISHKGDYVEK